MKHLDFCNMVVNVNFFKIIDFPIIIITIIITKVHLFFWLDIHKEFHGLIMCLGLSSIKISDLSESDLVYCASEVKARRKTTR